MPTEEKMKAYINKTQMGNTLPYSMTIQELQLAYEMTADNRFFEMLGLIFKYGMAKGYRKAQNERKKNERNQPKRGT